VADVSVRPADPGDVAELARIQVVSWQTGYTAVLPTEILNSLHASELEAGWTAAVSHPPSSRHHVMVATEGDWRVGFSVFGPDDDVQPDDPSPDRTVSITLLLVEPRWGRRGHGSRLLAAVADLAALDGADRLVAWVPAADTASLEFYRSAGWEADGLQRVLDAGSAGVTELRLHASLTDSAPDATIDTAAE
jgi:ribosomal protein S18 acetylase RimI-like enzyme